MPNIVQNELKSTIIALWLKKRREMVMMIILVLARASAK